MSFNDILKKSFLEGFSSVQIGIKETVFVLAITAIIATYVFFVYRLMTRRTFYSKNFNISLVVVALITAAIILTIQTSVVVSLGMVGALSIVRFRTAIKEPIDLCFLFWSISVGIICGAGHAEIAIVLTLIVTIMLFVFELVPIAKAPKILILSLNNEDGYDEEIKNIIGKYCKDYREKSRRVSKNKIELIYEIRIQEVSKLTQKLSEKQYISNVSIIEHDGEVTF
ncbi:MAG: DUF4956 domain-containing protein [Lachnospiraceae bacterium]|nr:DUF4956 domain-containing protein [Lachnospiraceae bacterium]